MVATKQRVAAATPSSVMTMILRRVPIIGLVVLLLIVEMQSFAIDRRWAEFSRASLSEGPRRGRKRRPWTASAATTTTTTARTAWTERSGEWEWAEEDPGYAPPPPVFAATLMTTLAGTSATPKLPSGSYRPKQSLGQNYLKDPNTVAKMLRAFHQDAIKDLSGAANKGAADATVRRIVELGPGAGALTDRLVETYGTDILHCIEIDARSVALLRDRHPGLMVEHADVLQVDYAARAATAGAPLTVVGNLPYYITSQILFALADAAHQGAVRSATVTVQWEVGQRLVAPTHCKDYGILSVVFQLYATVKCHFKIPPTVFYPQPKVDSALLGLHFLDPIALRRRLCGVRPADLRRVLTAAFQQRRKTIRNSLKTLCGLVCAGDAVRVAALLSAPPQPLPEAVAAAAKAGDAFAGRQALPANWASRRPEELSPGQFVELTRLVFGAADGDIDAAPLDPKVWRKLKHGTSDGPSAPT